MLEVSSFTVSFEHNAQYKYNNRCGDFIQNESKEFKDG